MRFPRAPAAGAAPAHSGGTPSKATVEHFVAATSFEAVSMVGRAAMFLGNAVVDGIEGTAELVQNAAKKADRIAMNVARCVPRRNTPRFPSRRFFFHPAPSRFPRIPPRAHVSRSRLSSPRSPDGTPRGHASRARGADAWGDFGDENANVPSHRSRGGVSVGGRVLSALSNLSPGSRRAHARGPASPPKRAAALAPRSPLRKNSPSRAARSRAAARASSAAVSSSSAAARGSEDDGEDWGWRAASPVKDEGELASAVRSAVAHLRRELDAANASEAELRATLASVRSELAEERATTESLKKQNLGLQRRQVQRDQEKDGSDPLAEQVRFQLEALVKEKAELARENDALWRENESLQELLMHSNMASMAEAMYSPGGALADLVPQPDFSEAEAETQKTEVNAAGEAPVQAKEAVDATEAKAEETVEVTETEAKAEEAVEVTETEAKAEETVEVTEAKEVEVSETVEVTDAAAAPDAEMETRDAPAEEAEAAVAEAAVAEHPGDVSTPEAPAAAPEAPAAAPIVPAAQKQAKGGKKGKKGKRGKK